MSESELREKEYPPIKSKRDFVRRYAKGEFGNRSPTWSTLAEFQASSYQGLVHLRNRTAGAKGTYNVSRKQVPIELLKLRDKGVPVENIYISGMAPHDRGTIQGELRRDTGVLHLRYNTQRVPMRDGFAIEDIAATGCAALYLILKHMDGSSYEWVETLLDRYPNHIIEFSCFEIGWGTLPTRNTVIWEVRPDRDLGSNLSPHTDVY